MSTVEALIYLDYVCYVSFLTGFLFSFRENWVEFHCRRMTYNITYRSGFADGRTS